ncbi:MAG: ATP-dependent DNA helicase RecG [Ruminococcus sp.]|jgi:ATP-dependent DNA helicase RecG
MTDSIRDLKGVGEKTQKLFGKVGVSTKEDLIHYYPRDYDVYQQPVSVSAAAAGSRCAVKARISQTLDVKKMGSRTVVTGKIQDETGSLSVIWFNMPFLRSVLKKGGIYVFRGRVEEKNGRLCMDHPEYFTLGAYEGMIHFMQPVYGLTKGLTNKMVVKAVKQLLEGEHSLEEYLPESFRKEYGLEGYRQALCDIHFPERLDVLENARKRLVFDEFLFFILTVARLKEQAESSQSVCPLKEVWKTEEIIESLPYELTGAQKNVWYEIERDMKSRRAMARLVQGDVGSGKTIIAFLAMIMAAENGAQAALMAPTEVLARQHYESLRDLLNDQDWEKYQPLLLTGSNTAKEKRERYELLKEGKSKIAIGTHALFQKNVEYENLVLVITDEQHRFGVHQREEFSKKGEKPNVLVMSATPIPRTLAVILYGDLDISVIDELPARRLPIKNCVVDQRYRKTAYRFIREQVEEGHQAYIICPLVEESEGLDAENVTDYEKMLRDLWQGKVRTGILHGKMKPADKNEVMEKFASGDIQVLVGTTVVEVGVNVPNATVMMVENAERFGLASLHQLRGRVGRGDAQSYCIFMQGNQEQEHSRRLDILGKTNDGFQIASEDMKLRGPGDLLGFRQSGDMEFKLADIYQDSKVLEMASKAAGWLMDNGRLENEEYRKLLKKLKIYMKNRMKEIQL